MADVCFRVAFFRTEAGAEPVRDWLKELSREDRKTIGEDIKTVQFGWPLGMPLVRKLDSELWEVRSQLRHRTARVIFTVQQDVIVLLHSFVKKSQRTPLSDLNVARKRLAQFKEHAP
jgi:phage-related protein